MKSLSASAKTSGFTLFEVLVVVAIIVTLMLVLLPTSPRKVNATGYRCLSNQKQICLGFVMFEGDNGDNFPWQLSTATNGTMELITNGHAFSQFLPLTNYIKSPQVYVCPTDTSRGYAATVATLTDSNLSFFVNADAPTNNPAAILIGDRHLSADGRPLPPGLFVFTTNAMDWTHALHPVKRFETLGALGFADGHCEIVKGKDLNARFTSGVLPGSRLEVP